MPNKQSEQEFLKHYDANAFERPSVAIDTTIYTIIDGALHVLLIKRAEHPFQGEWSLVGGYIDMEKDNNLMDTARRKLREKTAVDTPYLEQCLTIGNKERDPRGWSVTTVYFALLPHSDITLQAGTEASDIKWAKVSKDKIKEKLAFDHEILLQHSLQRLKNKVLYTNLPMYLMPEKFTLSELQKTYEIILGKSLDVKSFRRRINKASILTETDELSHQSRRPAKLYQLNKNMDIYYFLRNIEGGG